MSEHGAGFYAQNSAGAGKKMDDLRQFTRLLVRQWWFDVIALLGLLSTVATFVPAYYPRFAVPRWAVLIAFAAALFVASFRVYKEEVKRGALEASKAKETVAQLQREVVALRVRPYDDQRRSVAEQMLGGYSIRQRDLLRYVLVHTDPTVHKINGSTKLSPEEVNRDVQGLERDDVIRRDEDLLRGVVRFSVNQAWAAVFQDLLLPRRETQDPAFYG